MKGNGFAKGFLVGGMIGATVSMIMDPNIMGKRTRKRIVRSGKHLLRKSGTVIGDVIDLFR